MAGLSQSAYESVMHFISSLELPYSDGPIQVRIDFEIYLRDAVRRVFPNWQQFGCPFHFNQVLFLKSFEMSIFVEARIRSKEYD